jgi:hypothetical protein
MSGQHVYRRGAQLPVIKLLLRYERQENRRALEARRSKSSRVGAVGSASLSTRDQARTCAASLATCGRPVVDEDSHLQQSTSYMEEG